MKMQKYYTFDTDLVLRNRKGKNPYGLIDEYGDPFTFTETIELFAEMKVTDDELIDLNDYIKEDSENTFYDNCWNMWDERGCECNFIEGMRFNKLLIEEMTTRQNNYDSRQDITDYSGFGHTFTCRYEDSEWEGKIINVVNHSGYLEFTATGRGSSIKTYIGDSTSELWACFPAYNRGTSLSRPEDAFWNSEKLSDVLESIPDGITAANAIKALANLINATKQ